MNGSLYNQGVSAEDFGVQFGFSLFETFLVRNDCSVFLLDRHIDRLFQSMSYFNFDINMDKAKFQQLIVSHIEYNDLNGKVLRVTVTYGNKKKGIDSAILFSSRGNPYNNEVHKSGLKLMVADFKRNETSPVVMHKTGNYLENYTANNNALSKGYDDALFLNSKNEITETARSNIFFVSQGILHTPDSGCGLLPGIIRGWIIEKSGQLGINCKPGHYALESLLNADEIFVTNSIMGIVPVTNIEGRPIKYPASGSVTGMLIKEFQTLFHSLH